MREKASAAKKTHPPTYHSPVSLTMIITKCHIFKLLLSLIILLPRQDRPKLLSEDSKSVPIWYHVPFWYHS